MPGGGIEAKLGLLDDLIAGHREVVKGQKDLLERTGRLEEKVAEEPASTAALAGLAAQQGELLSKHEGLMAKTGLLDELLGTQRELVERTSALEAKPVEERPVVPEEVVGKLALLEQLVSGHEELLAGQKDLLMRTRALEERPAVKMEGEGLEGQALANLSASQGRLLAGHEELLAKTSLLDDLLARTGALEEKLGQSAGAVELGDLPDAWVRKLTAGSSEKLEEVLAVQRGLVERTERLEEKVAVPVPIPAPVVSDEVVARFAGGQEEVMRRQDELMGKTALLEEVLAEQRALGEKTAALEGRLAQPMVAGEGVVMDLAKGQEQLLEKVALLEEVLAGQRELVSRTEALEVQVRELPGAGAEERKRFEESVLAGQERLFTKVGLLDDLVEGQKRLFATTESLKEEKGLTPLPVAIPEIAALAEGQNKLLSTNEELVRKAALLDEVVASQKTIAERASELMGERDATLVLKDAVVNLASGQERIVEGHQDLLARTRVLGDLELAVEEQSKQAEVPLGGVSYPVTAFSASDLKCVPKTLDELVEKERVAVPFEVPVSEGGKDGAAALVFRKTDIGEVDLSALGGDEEVPLPAEIVAELEKLEGKAVELKEEVEEFEEQVGVEVPVEEAEEVEELVEDVEVEEELVEGVDFGGGGESPFRVVGEVEKLEEVEKVGEESPFVVVDVEEAKEEVGELEKRIETPFSPEPFEVVEADLERSEEELRDPKDVREELLEKMEKQATKRVTVRAPEKGSGERWVWGLVALAFFSGLLFWASRGSGGEQSNEVAPDAPLVEFALVGSAISGDDVRVEEAKQVAENFLGSQSVEEASKWIQPVPMTLLRDFYESLQAPTVEFLDGQVLDGGVSQVRFWVQDYGRKKRLLQVLAIGENPPLVDWKSFAECEEVTLQSLIGHYEDPRTNTPVREADVRVWLRASPEDRRYVSQAGDLAVFRAHDITENTQAIVYLDLGRDPGNAQLLETELGKKLLKHKGRAVIQPILRVRQEKLQDASADSRNVEVGQLAQLEIIYVKSVEWK
ncbi:MAG: hypothetical protein AAGC74_09815 [Verrucomicrobiota bacterium]